MNENEQEAKNEPDKRLAIINMAYKVGHHNIFFPYSEL